MLMDPQQRLLLEEVASAVADADCSVDALQGASVGEHFSNLHCACVLHPLDAESGGVKDVISTQVCCCKLWLEALFSKMFTAACLTSRNATQSSHLQYPAASWG